MSFQQSRLFPSLETVEIGDGSSRLSKTIFFLLCFIPVFSTVLYGAVDSVTWMFLSLFWAVIILAWLAEGWHADGLLINTSTLLIPLAGLMLIGLIQLLPFGGSEVSTDLLSRPVSGALSLDPYATRFFLIRLVIYLVFFMACLTFINNAGRLKKSVILVIVFGSIMAFFGILQRLASPEMIYGLRETPMAIPFGSFFNQHHFAAFMEMTVGMPLAFLVARETGRDKRLLLLMAAFVMGLAIVMTGSRGGLIGFVSVIAFVGLQSLLSRKRSAERAPGKLRAKIGFAAGGAALVLIIFGTVLVLGGNESLFRGLGINAPGGDISNGRLHFWSIALKIFLGNPVLGAGLDAFGVAFTKFDTWNGIFRVEQAHNDYLQTLADAGLAGFACLAAYIYFLFRKGLGVIADTGDDFRRNAAIGALAGCFGILIHSFFDFPLRTPSNAFFFLLLSAIATVNFGGDIRRGSRHRSRGKSADPDQ